MTLTVEATYENGVLKPAQPLPLKEHEKVRVTVQSAVSIVQQTAGMVKCDDPDLIDWAATSPDLDFPEPKEGP